MDAINLNLLLAAKDALLNEMPAAEDDTERALIRNFVDALLRARRARIRLDARRDGATPSPVERHYRSLVEALYELEERPVRNLTNEYLDEVFKRIYDSGYMIAPDLHGKLQKREEHFRALVAS